MKFDPLQGNGSAYLTAALPSSTAAEEKDVPRVADFDELVDEVLAKKGPSKYTDGLSEDNWEEVSN